MDQNPPHVCFDDMRFAFCLAGLIRIVKPKDKADLIRLIMETRATYNTAMELYYTPTFTIVQYSDASTSTDDLPAAVGEADPDANDA